MFCLILICICDLRPPKFNSSPPKMVVGRRSFPIGAMGPGNFPGLYVKLREGILFKLNIFIEREYFQLHNITIILTWVSKCIGGWSFEKKPWKASILSESISRECNPIWCFQIWLRWNCAKIEGGNGNKQRFAPWIIVNKYDFSNIAA